MTTNADSGGTNLWNLPDHLLERIFASVLPVSLAHCASSCSRFRCIINSSAHIWNSMLHHLLGHDAGSLLSTQATTEPADVLRTKAITVSTLDQAVPQLSEICVNQLSPPRYLHRGCLHPDNRHAIIFGGQSSQGFHNDVLMLDTLRILPPVSVHTFGSPPSCRCSSGFARLFVEDEATGECSDEEFFVLFGGSRGFYHAFHNDTKLLSATFDRSNPTARWHDVEIISSSIPSPRWGHVFVRVSLTQALVFGGANLQHTFNDCWLLSLYANERSRGKLCVEWTQIDVIRKPRARAGAAATLLCSHSLLIAGGCSPSSEFSDLHEFRLLDKEWNKLSDHCSSVLDNRLGHSLNTIGRFSYVLGGRSGSTFHTNLLCLKDRESLSSLLANSACQRTGHCAITCNRGIFVCGGLLPGNQYDGSSFHITLF